MNRDQLEGFLWEWIDGEISEADLNRLEAYLAEHPEGREEHRRLLELSELLSSTEPVDVPAEQRGRIDSALATHQVPWRRQEVARGGRVRWCERPWPLRLAYMAAGFVMGAVVVALLWGGPGSGWIGHEPALRGVMTNRVMDREKQRFDLAQNAGWLNVAGGSRLFRVELDLTRSGKVKLFVEGGKGALRVESLDQGAASPIRVSAADRRVVVELTGPTRVTIGFAADRPAGVLHLRVTAGGETLLGSQVRLGGQGGGE